MYLSWNIIVKDDSELANLKRSVDSIYPYIDELIIVANGEKVKGIENYCSGLSKILYFYHKWTKDFSLQRNFCMSKISMKADMFGWNDADDVIIGAEHLREIANNTLRSGMDTVFFTYWYSCLFNGEPSAKNLLDVELTQMRERLIRPGSITWHKRLHETPIPVENIDYKYTQVKYSQDTPIAWLHLGVTRNLSEKEQLERMGRNRELLELELEDERKTTKGADPRTLLYLMKIYAESDDEKLLNKCMDMGKEYLLKSGWDAERAMCCAIVGQCLNKLGNSQDAKDFLFKAIKEYPYDPLLYLYIARVCYNLGQFREMKHWMTTGLSLDTAETQSNMTNLYELKTLSSELMMHYYFNGERNVRKAYQAMKLLYKEVPTADNKDNLAVLRDLNDLDEASEVAHKLILYYQALHNSRGIVEVVDSMPLKMQNLPFAWFMYNKHKEPRIWKSDEICYYASFGQAHFEQWGPENLKQGIGGSETAVIRLAQEWAKSGYKVIVYCDCGQQEGVHDGVIYLPYYKFNARDSFSTLINWRSTCLLGKVKAKKIILDYHDLFANDAVKDYQRYDALFVKSNYQRGLATSVPDEKVRMVSNGI